MSIGGHQSARMALDEWLTPPDILRALGPFDLDPCAPIARPWPMAAEHLTVHDDGLSRPWQGRVWCNPPYGAATGRWLERLAAHGIGTALIFARTETRAWFDHVWPKASAVLFIEGRLHFHHADGSRAPANSGAPSALVAYGTADAAALRDSGIEGALISLHAGLVSRIGNISPEIGNKPLDEQTAGQTLSLPNIRCETET